MLAELLEPRQWQPPEDRKFILSLEQIVELCEQAEQIFKEEATVLRLQGWAPSEADMETTIGVGPEGRKQVGRDESREDDVDIAQSFLPSLPRSTEIWEITCGEGGAKSKPREESINNRLRGSE